MRTWFSIAVALCLAACATVGGPPPEARHELAPTGSVRAAINYGNSALARRDPATGALSGVTVTLARELAARAGAPVELVGYDTVAKLLAGAASEWDVGFLAFDPARAQGLGFSAPYMEVEVTYVVAAASDLREASQVDRPGVRIVVGERNAADLFLTRNLKQATLVRVPNNPAAMAALKSGAAEAWAANKQELLQALDAEPGYRAVAGRFNAVGHAAAVPVARPAAAAFLREFIEDAKRSGLVARAIDEARVRGVVVAPSAK